MRPRARNWSNRLRILLYRPAGASGFGGPGRRRMPTGCAGEDDAAGGDTLIPTCYRLFTPPIGGNP
jgi:hypothetical protein